MKKFLLSVALLGMVFLANAQTYNTAIGLRGGFDPGLTFKTFIGKPNAIEAMLATRYNGGYNLTVMYEIHNSVMKGRKGGTGGFDSKGLLWYYGVGGHIGSYDGRYTPSHWAFDNRRYTVIGIDGIIGIEYTFPEVPINISVDYKPAFNLVGYTGFWGDNGALSLRYAF